MTTDNAQGVPAAPSTTNAGGSSGASPNADNRESQLGSQQGPTKDVDRRLKIAGTAIQGLAALITLWLAVVATCNIDLSRKAAELQRKMAELQRRPWLGVTTWNATADLDVQRRVMSLGGRYGITNYGLGAARRARTTSWLSMSKNREGAEHVIPGDTPSPLVVPGDTGTVYFDGKTLQWTAGQKYEPCYFHVLCEYIGAETNEYYYLEQVFFIKTEEVFAHAGETGAILKGTQAPEVSYLGRRERDGSIKWDE